jgi:hypothetical protein
MQIICERFSKKRRALLEVATGARAMMRLCGHIRASTRPFRVRDWTHLLGSHRLIGPACLTSAALSSAEVRRGAHTALRRTGPDRGHSVAPAIHDPCRIQPHPSAIACGPVRLIGQVTGSVWCAVAARHVRLSSGDHLCTCVFPAVGLGSAGPEVSVVAGYGRNLAARSLVSPCVLQQSTRAAGQRRPGGRRPVPCALPRRSGAVASASASPLRPEPVTRAARHLVAFDRADGPGAWETTGFIAELIGQRHHAT